MCNEIDYLLFDFNIDVNMLDIEWVIVFSVDCELDDLVYVFWYFYFKKSIWVGVF